ncbi:uncharacterized protein LOC107040733 [Diachasma alloeum]|uniref:uncharacterized protein LOC107040733 n=1 Tax=Diachasma alloeum TaxID=454923 RepID=UPI00073845FA|nr:uncharacterized protein LOC107040733 [Diachasma alloeum]
MSDTSWGSSLCARGVHRSRKRTGKTMLISVVVLFVAGSFCPSVTGEAGKQYKMSTICKNHFLRDLYRKIDGAVLLSQNERNLNCATTFQTHSILQRFMLRFDRLQLDCNDHLYIYDGAHAGSNYKADLSCQNTHLSVGAIYTRTNFVTLKYVTDGWGTDTNGFQLVITAIKDERHTCKDFRCTMNMFCIDEDLVCDGINHCGDGSDEVSSTLCANTEASTILGMQKTWFAVALVFSVLSITALLTAGVLCYCRRRGTTPRHSHNTHSAQMTHPPVSFPCELHRKANIIIKSMCFIHFYGLLCVNELILRLLWSVQLTPKSPMITVDLSLLTGLARMKLNSIKRVLRDMGLQRSESRRTFGLRMLTIVCLLSMGVFGVVLSNSVTYRVHRTDKKSRQFGVNHRDYFLGPCLVHTNQTCPDDEVTFFLYTRENPGSSRQILVNDSSSNLHETNFNPRHPTKIIVHGYNSDMRLDSLVDIRNEYLRKGSYNIIAVDWHRLAVAPCYPIAVHNVPHVGDCLAQLIERLRDNGATDIHAIGFSLGAHVPAFAANVLRPYKMPRITGLDPAMPLFVTVGKDEKLDSGDGDFVDVFHTNAFIQGKVETSGHIDFYMNGGINQPGCWENRNPFGCNHHRAAVYYAESINSPVGFWGWPCPGFLAYLLGLCPPRGPAVRAGDPVDENYRGFFLVHTRAQSPFAEGLFSSAEGDKTS